MFEPISAGITLGMGAIQSIVGYQQQQDAARQQNEQAMREYNQRLKIRQRQIIRDETAYNFRKQQYNTTLRNLSETAQAAYQQEDLRMGELMKSMRFARQGSNIAQARSQGKIAARGMTGKSAARMQALDAAAYGRNEAIRAERLFSAGQASDMRRDKIQRELTANREAAYAKVAFAPERPVMPLVPNQIEGPSNMSLMAGFAGALGNAALTGMSYGRQNAQLNQRNPTN